jgi:hypothetical protein
MDWQQVAGQESWGLDDTETQYFSQQMQALVVKLTQETSGKLPWHQALSVYTEDGALLKARFCTLHRIFSFHKPHETAHFLRRQPQLIIQPSTDLAERLVKLRLLLPTANIPGVVLHKPSLLLMQDYESRVANAVRQLRALMPGVAFERKLHEMGATWWSFTQLLESPQRTY